MEMQAERGNNYKEKDQEGRCKQEEAWKKIFEPGGYSGVSGEGS